MGELTSWRQRLRCRGDCQSLLPPASTPSVPTLCGSKLLSFHLAVCLPIPCPECCAAAAAWVPAVAGQSLAGSLLQAAVLIIATTFALFSFFSSQSSNCVLSPSNHLQQREQGCLAGSGRAMGGCAAGPCGLLIQEWAATVCVLWVPRTLVMQCDNRESLLAAEISLGHTRL